jgi:hypothetical protein
VVIEDERLQAEADGLPAGDDGTAGTGEDLSLGVCFTVDKASRKSGRVMVRPGHPMR